MGIGLSWGRDDLVGIEGGRGLGRERGAAGRGVQRERGGVLGVEEGEVG